MSKSCTKLRMRREEWNSESWILTSVHLSTHPPRIQVLETRYLYFLTNRKSLGERIFSWSWAILIILLHHPLPIHPNPTTANSALHLIHHRNIFRTAVGWQGKRCCLVQCSKNYWQFSSSPVFDLFLCKQVLWTWTSLDAWMKLLDNVMDC